MDTYFSVDWNCVKCGRCVVACQEKGEKFLVGTRDDCPHQSSDYVPCHHCTSFSEPAPCQSVCHYGAIEIERW